MTLRWRSELLCAIDVHKKGRFDHVSHLELTVLGMTLMDNHRIELQSFLFKIIYRNLIILSYHSLEICFLELCFFVVDCASCLYVCSSYDNFQHDIEKQHVSFSLS
jgi:hypothetical protein